MRDTEINHANKHRRCCFPRGTLLVPNSSVREHGYRGGVWRVCWTRKGVRGRGRREIVQVGEHTHTMYCVTHKIESDFFQHQFAEVRLSTCSMRWRPGACAHGLLPVVC